MNTAWVLAHWVMFVVGGVCVGQACLDIGAKWTARKIARDLLERGRTCIDGRTYKCVLVIDPTADEDTGGMA